MVSSLISVMKLLIDGYNLMFALNVVGQPGKGTCFLIDLPLS